MKLDHTKILILNSIDLHYFEDTRGDETLREQIALVYADFKLSSQWNIDRVGEQAACRDWLQGLPSCLNLPFMNYDILSWFKGVGLLELDSSEKEENAFLANYWTVCAAKLGQLSRGHQFPSEV